MRWLTCIGADQFKFTSFPGYFQVEPVTGPAWSSHSIANGLSNIAGVYGTTDDWDFLAYGAGDVDNSLLTDKADTWLISSSDGQLAATCPASPAPENVAAGEPFNVYNDVNCN
jgi:hypothetical protein